jgi:predicted O-methyltransferase YrrM
LREPYQKGLREKAANELEYYLYRVGKKLRRDANRIDPARYSPETPEEAEELFASHLPVLAGLARLIPVRRVLELGAGHYSTPAFLDRSAFGDLETLRSVEDDPVWVEKLSAVVRDDPRVDLVTVTRPMSKAVAGLRVQDYDLVLVDDSKGQEERIETIRNVAANASGSAALVVIHDYEWEVYQKAAGKFRRRFAFTALVPNTGVVWNKARVELRRLKELNALIEEYSERIKPQNFSEWVRLVNEHDWNIRGR